MSIITCRECKREISSKAKTCPGCGSPIEQDAGFLKLLVVAIGVVVVWSFISSTNFSGTPEKLPQNQPTAEDLKRKAQADRRFKAAFGLISEMKKETRNPSSFAVDQILSDDEPTIICVKFRAQNGFGGMNREILIFMDGKTSRNPKDWPRLCADGSMHDLTSARSLLR